MPNRHIEFDLDVNAIVDDYAANYVRHSYVHETIEEAAQRCALDLKMPDARKWFLTAVRRLRASGREQMMRSVTI